MKALGLIPFFLLGYVVVYVVYQRFFSPLAHIPGPFSASLSRWWLVKKTRGGQLHRDMIRQHEKYGHLVRTAPDEVSVADPRAIKKIYGMDRIFDAVISVG